MPTKKTLEETIKTLTEALEVERERPTGHIISNNHFDMGDTVETKLAVAEAVKEGMKALNSLGGDNYGIYMESGE